MNQGLGLMAPEPLLRRAVPGPKALRRSEPLKITATTTDDRIALAGVHPHFGWPAVDAKEGSLMKLALAVMLLLSRARSSSRFNTASMPSRTTRWRRRSSTSLRRPRPLPPSRPRSLARTRSTRADSLYWQDRETLKLLAAPGGAPGPQRHTCFVFSGAFFRTASRC